MNYRLNPDLNTINWQQVNKLFEKIDCTPREITDIRITFERSSFKVFVFDATSKIIAFGRTVDDGKYYAQLADIIVDPDHQGEHLGELVVKTLTEQLKDYHFITLTSAIEKADMFYRHLGWKSNLRPLFIPSAKNRSSST